MSGAAPLKTLTPEERQEAFTRGYNACHAGKTRELAESAYASPAMRREWRKGWDRASKGLMIQMPLALPDKC